MKPSEIKLQIKKLAEEFDLKYKDEWFDYMWISIRQEILMEYVGDCPDPIYIKYGKTVKERIKNIDEFVGSEDFRKCLKRYGGSVGSRKSWEKEKRLYEIISNVKLRKELLKFHYRVKKRFGKTDYIAFITKTKVTKHYGWLMEYGLRHEWIHILLDKNKIQFQEIDKKYWPYDEGVNEYMGCYLDGMLSGLENYRDNEDYPMERKNWVYAIKLRNLLKDKKTSSERKMALLELIRRLRKRR